MSLDLNTLPIIFLASTLGRSDLEDVASELGYPFNLERISGDGIVRGSFYTFQRKMEQFVEHKVGKPIDSEDITRCFGEGEDPVSAIIYNCLTRKQRVPVDAFLRAMEEEIKQTHKDYPDCNSIILEGFPSPKYVDSIELAEKLIRMNLPEGSYFFMVYAPNHEGYKNFYENIRPVLSATYGMTKDLNYSPGTQLDEICSEAIQTLTMTPEWIGVVDHEKASFRTHVPI
ncbi:uncharacterized protein F4822DRAFT_432763 [Hypoxylon trugodes]|uniref:uncharacterized protein n=1 Tax=Hypoxylon trugodes TaxID=326681 RepID=UPI0021951115|nr:uncharacterized protein F4822DRAFT_432763 [Hypoxylon trugodes]KAI1385902.1 hypothetical protein F4822DRAFT_432763 [Hypoxylon trugodes]